MQRPWAFSTLAQPLPNLAAMAMPPDHPFYRLRDFKLDTFKWIKDESLEDADELPEPDELATDAIAELEGAVSDLNAVLELLERDVKVTA